MLVEMLSELRCNYMLHHLAKYACQGDGPIIGWITFTSLLKSGLTLAFVQFDGILPVEIDFWKSR